MLGGLLPVIAFTVIEEFWGIAWGVVAGMVFGLSEVLYERIRLGKVSALTWGSNGMILVLGGLSLFTQEGIWFKLQSAIMEAVMTLVLWGSCLMGKPIMVMMAEKQLPEGLPEAARARMISLMRGMTLRMGAFFGVHAVLATWAALAWSTAAWGFLKGVGFTLSLFLYMGLEGGLMLRSARSAGNAGTGTFP